MTLLDERPINEPSLQGPLLDDGSLVVLAETVFDLEKTRIGNSNRLAILTKTEPDEDGVQRGFGLSELHPAVQQLQGLVTGLEQLEAQAVRELEKAMKRHPLGPWVAKQNGIGLKTVARLLAVIGDPYWNTADNKPRTVSQLWAYSGYHVFSSGQAARRQKGVQANWSTQAKTRTYLIAESCIKRYVRATCPGDEHKVVTHAEDCACSPFRKVYDARRAHTVVSNPDWTDGHRHNDAIRVTAKEVLKELWRESRRLHEEMHEAAFTQM